MRTASHAAGEPLLPESLGDDFVGLGMRRWHREFPEVDCSGKAVIGRVLHLHDVILRRVERVLARHGLRYASYAVLATLRVEGEPFQMSPTAILNSLILTSGGLSNLLRRMEQDGYITRTSDQRDGRGVVVALTPRGRAVIEPAMRDHAAVELQIIAKLSTRQRRSVAEALKTITGVR